MAYFRVKREDVLAACKRVMKKAEESRDKHVEKCYEHQLKGMKQKYKIKKFLSYFVIFIEKNPKEPTIEDSKARGLDSWSYLFADVLPRYHDEAKRIASACHNNKNLEFITLTDEEIDMLGITDNCILDYQSIETSSDICSLLF